MSKKKKKERAVFHSCDGYSAANAWPLRSPPRATTEHLRAEIVQKEKQKKERKLMFSTRAMVTRNAFLICPTQWRANVTDSTCSLQLTLHAYVSRAYLLLGCYRHVDLCNFTRSVLDTTSNVYKLADPENVFLT